jgi:signal transduction histidine kinase
MTDVPLSEFPHLKPLLDALATPVVIVNPERRITYFNQAFVVFTGLRPRELRDGMACLVCKGKGEGCLADRCRETGNPISLGEVPIALPAGGEGRITVVGVPLKDAQGRTVATMEQYVDVSGEERVHTKYRATVDLEREARMRAEVLAEEVLSQFKELQEAHEGLREAHEKLREAYSEIVTLSKSVTVGALAGGIAHELNNPLAIIEGHCEMMMDVVGDLRKKGSAEAQPLEDWIGVVRESVDRCHKITKGLLGFMRGPTSTLPAETPLKTVIDEALSLTRFQRVARTVDIQVSVPEDLPPVPLIRDMAVQAISNLVGNACQALGGKGSVAIRAKPIDGRVELRISDDGPGLPEEVRQRLFKPFTSTKAEGKGTGLGLFLTKFIVERHGGKIAVEDAPKGTTFVITLPLNR